MRAVASSLCRNAAELDQLNQDLDDLVSEEFRWVRVCGVCKCCTGTVDSSPSIHSVGQKFLMLQNMSAAHHFLRVK